MNLPMRMKRKHESFFFFDFFFDFFFGDASCNANWALHPKHKKTGYVHTYVCSLSQKAKPPHDEYYSVCDTLS